VVEREPEELRVGGSIPSSGTIQWPASRHGEDASLSR